MQFDNGFGVSVVKNEYTYGGRVGLWEVAILKNDVIAYDTRIGKNVIGWCTEDDVTRIMKQVQELS